MAPLSDREDACAAVLARLEAGAVSSPIALMELLIAAEDAHLVERIVRARSEVSPHAAALLRLVRENEDGCNRVAAMLRADVDVPPRQASIEEGIAFCRRLFDWSVQQSEEASVALYSLGNPALLAAATRELVELFSAWGVLGATRDALDLGCGIGRLEQALSSSFRLVHGIDVSEKMIDVASRRCAGLSNVSFATCSGLDLAPLENASFDVVLAVDSFPYLVQTGMPLVAAHFAEAGRVLRCGGDLLVLGFSYREDDELDRADVAAQARDHGFSVLAAGTRPFALWNALAFHLRRDR